MKTRAKSAVDWYRKNKSTYDDLVDNLKELIKSLLAAHGTSFADIQGRSKSIESFTDNPQEGASGKFNSYLQQS